MESKMNPELKRETSNEFDDFDSLGDTTCDATDACLGDSSFGMRNDDYDKLSSDTEDSSDDKIVFEIKANIQKTVDRQEKEIQELKSKLKKLESDIVRLKGNSCDTLSGDNKPVISVRKNLYDNYEHSETGFVFSKTGKVYGKQVGEEVVPLTEEDIKVCKYMGFAFIISPSLNKLKTEVKNVSGNVGGSVSGNGIEDYLNKWGDELRYDLRDELSKKYGVILKDVAKKFVDEVCQLRKELNKVKEFISML